nr:secoisolariciresinol dehydrogenase-like isoform X2 [Coffea arabica]XP_027116723.1 secoisolariciresinol dehydrogenase-like isoform X2 [Coffea arabica]
MGRHTDGHNSQVADFSILVLEKALLVSCQQYIYIYIFSEQQLSAIHESYSVQPPRPHQESTREELEKITTASSLEENNMFSIRSSSSSISRALLARSFVMREFCAQRKESKLEGKVALITGAARGIGKETATKFITNGAKVVIADIRRDVGQETARQLGANASFVACDVSQESDVSNAVDYTVSTHGQLDIMYNNAGIACRTPPSVVDLDLAAFDKVVSINVRGAVAGIKHASRVMIPRQAGCILCTASVTGMMGGLAQHTYSITKSSVIGMVKSVAAELCKHGIRVNCISPFAIPTAFALEEMQDYFPGLDAGALADMVHNAGVLKGANCEPSDVANAALYLASDDAKYISGHNLVVDGGFTSIKSLNFAGT